MMFVLHLLTKLAATRSVRMDGHIPAPRATGYSRVAIASRLAIHQHRSVFRTRSLFDWLDSNCRLVVGSVGLLNQESRRQHDKHPDNLHG